METLYLAFDTETTGIGNFKLPPTDHTQPEMVQLAASLYDECGYSYHELNVLVAPDRPVEPKAAEVHGLTNEMLERCGIPRRSALSMFHALLKRADVLVAHNINFDTRVLQAAYYRENVDSQLFLGKTRYCTMLESVPICKLPHRSRPGQWKWPSLDEAYRHLVDPNGFGDAHDAMVDVRACSAVHRQLMALDNAETA